MRHSFGIAEVVLSLKFSNKFAFETVMNDPGLSVLNILDYLLLEAVEA